MENAGAIQQTTKIRQGEAVEAVAEKHARKTIDAQGTRCTVVTIQEENTDTKADF